MSPVRTPTRFIEHREFPMHFDDPRETIAHGAIAGAFWGSVGLAADLFMGTSPWLVYVFATAWCSAFIMIGLFQMWTTRPPGAPIHTNWFTRHASAYGAGHAAAKDLHPCTPPGDLEPGQRRAWVRGWRRGERYFRKYPDGVLDTPSARRAIGAELREELDAERGGTLEERRERRNRAY